MAIGAGGRVVKVLLGTDGATLDAITSTTDTTVSTESIRVPEGFQACFVLDFDAWATAALTASVKYTHDDSTWHQFYWDEASATAATFAVTEVGQKILQVINPFVDNPNLTTSVMFRVDFETDTADTDVTFGDCYVTIGPPIKGAVFETLL
jgi:hypothetical protein